MCYDEDENKNITQINEIFEQKMNKLFGAIEIYLCILIRHSHARFNAITVKQMAATCKQQITLKQSVTTNWTNHFFSLELFR